jgi:Ca-activated chloride channel family protein
MTQYQNSKQRGCELFEAWRFWILRLFRISSLGFEISPKGLLVLVLALLLPIQPVRSQKPDGQQPPKGQQPRQQDPKPDVELKAELVELPVTVVDQKNQVVSDLDKSRFVVYEDNNKQEVSLFSREETPVSLGLVLDTSGSMKKKLSKVIAAAKSLVRQSHPRDEYFVIEYKEEAELIEDFTSEIGLISDALDNMIASGPTALLDAVYLSVDHAQKRGRNQRKAVLLVTDGEERDSYYKRDQVFELLRKSEVQVYVIGFPQGLGEAKIFVETESKRLNKDEKRARKLVEELAQVSGGRAFFPQSLDELDPIAATIARELRLQYIIGYTPSNSQRDGTWRTVRIEVTPDKQRGKLTARTRAGYYAVKTQP